MTFKDGCKTINSKFMASCDSYETASVVIVGAPMDFTSSFRPGARFGPQKIREVSVGLEEYSIYNGKSLEDIKFFDAGDLDLPFGNVKESLRIIGDAASRIISDAKFPLFIGGEHLISLPIIKKAYEKYGNELVILHLDAHADLREEYLGCSESHASVIRRLTDFMPAKNIIQLGIRSGTREEFEFASHNTHMYKFDVAEPLKSLIPAIETKPVYVTLDIDVVDPAYANGTGTPEPGGISSRELLEAVLMLSGINIVGFDIVEVAPVYDASDRTALLAAKAIREVVLMVNNLSGGLSTAEILESP